MKRMTALFITLVLILALLPSAALAVETVSDASALIAALNGTATEIELGSSITISPEDNIRVAGRNVTLDLKGNTLTVSTDKVIIVKDAASFTVKDTLGNGVITKSGSLQLFQVQGGSTLTVAGGKITANGGFTVFVRDSGSTVNVTGGTIENTNNYGIALSGNGTAGQGGTTIEITSGAVTGGEFGIYHPQSGTLNISGGAVSGQTGVGIKSGEMTVSGNATIRATGSSVDPVPFNNGINTVGAGIQIESNSGYDGNMQISISGGEISSTNGYAVHEYLKTADSTIAVDSFSITGGKLTGNSGKAAMSFTDGLAAKSSITGGNFSDAVSLGSYKNNAKFVVDSTTAGYFTLSDTAPTDPNVVAEESTTPSVPEAAQLVPATVADTVKNDAKTQVDTVVTSTNTKVEDIDSALSEDGKEDIIASSGIDITDVDAATQEVKIAIEVVVTAKTAGVVADTTDANKAVINTLTFEIAPVATVAVVAKDDGAVASTAPNTVPVSDDMLNGRKIKVTLGNPMGADLKEIVHVFQRGGSEAFHTSGVKRFVLSGAQNEKATIEITEFSEVILNRVATRDPIMPSSNNYSAPVVKHIGNGVFSTNVTSAPTRVELDGMATERYTRTGMRLTLNDGLVGGGTHTLKVYWGNASAQTSFILNNEIEVPKTGDVSVLAMALCAVLAAAGLRRRG